MRQAEYFVDGGCEGGRRAWDGAGSRSRAARPRRRCSRCLADESAAVFEAQGLPWDKLQLFWVDERCVAPDGCGVEFRHDEDGDAGQGAAARRANIHRMEGELDPDEAASRYESEIRNTFKLEGAETPTFDMILLGLGPDGHTASLFPHTEGLERDGADLRWRTTCHRRMCGGLTLTWPVITQGSRRWRF